MKKVFIIGLLFLLLCSCQSHEALKITDIKANVCYTNETDRSISIAWYTSIPTKCILSYCQANPDICIGSEEELQYATLHLFVCAGLPENTEYFVITAKNKDGDVVFESYNNPLTK